MSDFLARIKPKKSTVTGEVPAPEDLEVSELAINTADGKLFTKHTDNSIKTIVTDSASLPLNDITDVTITSPTNGQILQYSSGVWVNDAPTGVGSITATTPISSTGGSSPIISLDNTAVTPGSYTNTSLTVDAKGRLTAASSGTAPVTSVLGTSPIISSGGTTPSISLGNTTVTPGSYTYGSFTVDAKGRLTAASSGTAPVTSVAASGLITSTGGTTPTISSSIPANTLVGRYTGSTGVFQSVTLGSGLSISGTSLNVGLSLDSLTDVTITGTPSNGSIPVYNSATSQWVNTTGYLFTTSSFSIADGRNIDLGTTNGTKIGTSPAQRLGFYGVTPVSQPSIVTNITTTAVTGTLPTVTGNVQIANTATPTNTELLKYCSELQYMAQATLSRLKSIGIITSTGSDPYLFQPVTGTAAPILGAASATSGGGWTLIQNANGDDTFISSGAFGFNIVLANTNYGSTFIGSNPYATFGSGFGTNNISASNPSAPKIIFFTGDRSYQRIYTRTGIVAEGYKFASFRYEGNTSFSGTPGASTVIYECTFFEPLDNGNLQWIEIRFGNTPITSSLFGIYNSTTAYVTGTSTANTSWVLLGNNTGTSWTLTANRYFAQLA